MGAIIKALSLSQERSESSYLRSGASAIRKCLEQSSTDVDRLGLLINTGVYRDRHIHEPAIASLIQGELQKSYPLFLAETFSFDLHHGGGGAVMALRILHGFIESGKIEHGIVLAGDAEPFDGSAGAILVSRGLSKEGFQHFSQETYLPYSGDFRSYSNNSGNKIQMHVDQDNKYVEHCLLCSRKSVDGFLARTGLELGDIDLIIPSQSPEGFASELAAHYGQERVIGVKGDRVYYSAGVMVAMSQAQSLGLFRESTKVLIVSVGPGITVDLAFYIHPG